MIGCSWPGVVPLNSEIKKQSPLQDDEWRILNHRPEIEKHRLNAIEAQTNFLLQGLTSLSG